MPDNPKARSSKASLAGAAAASRSRPAPERTRGGQKTAREPDASPARRAHFVVVANLKGGSGKSMVAFNLGVWLAGLGARVRLVDLDPQKTLTDLVAVRRELDMQPSLDSPLDAIDGADDGGGGVWTLVDVGAADVPRMRQAVRQADIVLVPVVPGQADIWATQRFLQMIKGERKAAAPVRLIVNRADPLGVARETREAIVALKVMASMLEGVGVLPTHLGPRVAFSRSLSEGLAVFELEPKSKASAEFKALAQASIPPP